MLLCDMLFYEETLLTPSGEKLPTILLDFIFMKWSHDKHMLYYKEKLQFPLETGTATILLNFV